MGEYDNYPLGTWSGDPAAPWNAEDGDYDEGAYELSPVEQLAIAQAFYKAAADLVSTKKSGNLRSAVDDEYRKLYESTGAKSFDVKLFGGKVGTYSIVVEKPTESTSHVEIKVRDGSAFDKWARDNKFVVESVDWDAVYSHLDDTGEVPEGCDIETVITPGRPGGAIKSTSLRIDQHEVLDAVGYELGNVSAMLLEGGE